jgi:hypothetical protein
MIAFGLVDGGHNFRSRRGFSRLLFVQFLFCAFCMIKNVFLDSLQYGCIGFTSFGRFRHKLLIAVNTRQLSPLLCGA